MVDTKAVPDEDRYFDLEGAVRYSGLSMRTLRRYMDDPVHPLPHHHVCPTGKGRGRVLIRKSEFDAWVASFPPRPSTRRPPIDMGMDARVGRALARSRG